MVKCLLNGLSKLNNNELNNDELNIKYYLLNENNYDKCYYKLLSLNEYKFYFQINNNNINNNIYEYNINNNEWIISLNQNNKEYQLIFNYINNVNNYIKIKKIKQSKINKRKFMLIYKNDFIITKNTLFVLYKDKKILFDIITFNNFKKLNINCNLKITMYIKIINLQYTITLYIDEIEIIDFQKFLKTNKDFCKMLKN